MTPRRAATCVLALALAAAVAPGQGGAPDPARKALKDMEGVYTLQRMNVGGVEAKPAFVKDRRFLVREVGGKHQLVALTWIKKDGKDDRVVEEVMWITAIDPTKTPARIDFAEPAGGDKTRPTFGIYSFANDTLTVCATDTEDPAARPAGFDPKQLKPKDHLLVLKRVEVGK